MANGNDKSADTQDHDSAAGKDVLFGWLVGRAAADLGLAQALAASEAQRVEQFKRLEASLLGQIRDLQNSSNPDSAHRRSIELEDLTSQVEKLVERTGGLESFVQQLVTTPDLVNVQVSSLEAKLDQRQGLLEAQQTQAQRANEEILAKVQDLEHRVDCFPQTDQRALTDLTDLKQELLVMRVRLERTESSHKEFQDRTTADIARVQEATANYVRIEVADLKAQITQLLDQQAINASSFRIVETLQREIEILRGDLTRNAEKDNKITTDLTELRMRTFDLAQQVESVGSTAATAAANFETERMRLDHEIAQRVAAGAEQLHDEIRQGLQNIHGIQTNDKEMSDGIDSLTARLRALEQANEELTEGINRELDSAKAILRERDTRYAVIEAQLKNLHEMVGVGLQQVDKNLAQIKQRLDGGEAHDQEFRAHLEQMAQRIAEIESIAQQTRTSMINESVQTAQEKNEFAAELGTLRMQLRGMERWEAAIRVIEDRLNARVQGLESQLEKIPNLDSRQSEVPELKAQLENINEKLAAMEIHSQSQQLLMSRVSASAPMTFDPLRRSQLPGEHAKSAGPRAQAERQERQAATQSADASIAKGLVETEGQLQTLQARMSADIERARAELREKSGRWKLRHEDLRNRSG